MKHLPILALLATGLFLSTAALQAQYTLDWHTIDAGGATSIGGTYTLGGTIGQPDANAIALTGGSYSLEGGFWQGLILAPSGDGPTLFIQFVGGNVIVSWTPATPGFTLQQTDNLASTAWTSAPAGNPTPPLPAGSGTLFYRLTKP